MSKCIDTNIGTKLHAYEIGQLSSDESDQFEMHLMECGYCFNQADNFDPAIDMIRSDPDFKSIVSEAAVNKQVSTSWYNKLISLLWPKTNMMLKPAVVYFLLVLMAYPAYLGLKKFNQSSIDEVTTVMLTSNRSTSVPVSLKDNNLVVMFRINGANKGNVYSVNIVSEEGNQLYRNDKFTNFDEYEMASLLFYSENLIPGVYSVEILQPENNSFSLKYIFSIK